MAPRGRGGKFSKPTRGGGKHFSRDLQPLDKEGNPIGMWREGNKKDETSSEEEEESSEEEESDSAGEGTSKPAGGEMTREQRRQAAKEKKQRAIERKNRKAAAPGDMPSSDEEEEESEDDADMPANPNHTAKSRKQAQVIAAPTSEPAAPEKKKAGENLSRREREALQAQQAKERYQKLHAEGKTDEARADLARLRLIKEEREAAAARKAAEKEEREEREKENQAKNEREAKLRAAAIGGAGEKKKSLKGKK